MDKSGRWDNEFDGSDGSVGKSEGEREYEENVSSDESDKGSGSLRREKVRAREDRSTQGIEKRAGCRFRVAQEAFYIQNSDIASETVAKDHKDENTERIKH